MVHRWPGRMAKFELINCDNYDAILTKLTIDDSLTTLPSRCSCKKLNAALFKHKFRQASIDDMIFFAHEYSDTFLGVSRIIGFVFKNNDVSSNKNGLHVKPIEQHSS